MRCLTTKKNPQRTCQILSGRDGQQERQRRAVASSQQLERQQEDCREEDDEDLRVAQDFDRDDEPCSLKVNSSHAFLLRNSCKVRVRSHTRTLSFLCGIVRYKKYY